MTRSGPGRPPVRAAFAAAVAAASLAHVAPIAAAAPTPTPPSTAAPAPTPLSVAAYHHRVATAAALAARPAGAATAAALVGRPAAVRLPARAGGSATDAAAGADRRTRDDEAGAAADAARDDADRIITAEPLAASAAGTGTPPAGLAARLAVVRDELAAAGGDAPAAQAAALARVLESSAFRDRRSLWQRARDWLGERLERWWGDRRLPAGTGATALRVGQAIGWLVALLVVAATLTWLARFVGGLTDAGRLAGGGEAAPATPAAARARAEAHALAGDHRAAVRQLYLAALLVLEAHGLVPADRSRTNREHLAALAGGEALRRQMAAVVDTFDRVWYGVTEPDDATFVAYRADVERLEALARAARADVAPAAGHAAEAPP